MNTGSVSGTKLGNFDYPEEIEGRKASEPKSSRTRLACEFVSRCCRAITLGFHATGTSPSPVPWAGDNGWLIKGTRAN